MSRPKKLLVQLNSVFAPESRYEFERGVVSVWCGGRLQRSCTPTLEQWSGFWRLCTFLEIWDWLTEYVPTEQVRDGQSWSVEIELDRGRRVSSRGNNGYPALETVQSARVTIDRFGLLLHFIDMCLMTGRYDFRDDYAV